jgi:hypothetical protein
VIITPLKGEQGGGLCVFRDFCEKYKVIVDVNVIVEKYEL